MDSNKKKAAQLGMAQGTAANRLRKQIMFSLMQTLEIDNCHQCGEKIKHVKNLSIEHIIPWLDSGEAVSLYFDINNIAFSHLSCNSRAGSKIPVPDGMRWCSSCQKAMSADLFTKGRNSYCRPCQQVINRNRRDRIRKG